jgi:hypothetical protein
MTKYEETHYRVEPFTFQRWLILRRTDGYVVGTRRTRRDALALMASMEKDHAIAD